MNIVIVGAGTTFGGRSKAAVANRALVNELKTRGHDILLLEQLPNNRDRRKTRRPRALNSRQFRSTTELKARFTPRVRDAHVVIVGAPLADTAGVGKWVTRVAKGVTAFYDTAPADTLDQLEHPSTSGAARTLIPKFDLYLAATEEPDVEKLQQDIGTKMARSLPSEDAANVRAAQLERFVAEAMSGQLMA